MVPIKSMKNTIFLIVFLIQAICAFSQNNVLENRLSSLIVPIEIDLSSIERTINSEIPIKIYEDLSFSNNNNDNLQLIVTRIGNLKFNNKEEGLLTYTVPVYIVAKQRISLLGLEKIVDTNFKMEVGFSTKLGFNPDWSTNSTTISDGFKYITRPLVAVSGSYKVDISEIISRVIDNNQTSIAKLIDNELEKGLHFKPYIEKVWNSLQEPILVSDEYESYIQIRPKNVNVAPIKTSATKIIFTIGLDAMLYNQIGGVLNSVSPITEIPNLSLVKFMKDGFQLNLLNLIDFGKASELAFDSIKEEEFKFNKDKYKIKIDALRLSENKGKLDIDLQIVGSFRGRVLLEGTPYISPEKDKILLKDVEFSLKSRNILHKTAAWLVESRLEKALEENLILELNPIYLALMDQLIVEFNQEFSPGLRSQCSLGKVGVTDIVIKQEGIVCSLGIGGVLKMKYNN